MKGRPIRSAVLTISDRCSQGETEDLSGPVVAEILSSWGWSPDVREILPDEEMLVAERLATLADTGFSLVITTGGTGLGPRDRTPEATLRVVDRQVPGLAELLRSRTGDGFPRAYLSRGIIAMRRHCLIVNLPGSTRGAREGIEALADVLPHALDVVLEDPAEGSAHGPETGRARPKGGS
jgi:molybdenum cofactor synthesis domain-containing protein